MHRVLQLLGLLLDCTYDDRQHQKTELGLELFGVLSVYSINGEVVCFTLENTTMLHSGREWYFVAIYIHW